MAKDFVSFYSTDFGLVLLPDDLPTGVYRKNGKPDKRRKIAPTLVRYFEDLREAAMQEYEAGKVMSDLETISWNEWLARS